MSPRRKERRRTYSASQLEALGCGEVSVIRKSAKKKGIKFTKGVISGNETKLYLYDFLPPEWQAKINVHEARATLQEHGIDPPEEFPPIDPLDINHVAVTYANAPEYNRRKFNKYAMIEHEAGLLEGQELKDWINTVWNARNPELKTSYASVMRERKNAKERGKTALIGQWGKRAGKSAVPTSHFEYFKSLCLKEGGPSYNSCWRQVVGKYCQGSDLSNFPSVDSFLRRLSRKVGESAIYLARNGKAKWNRKYASYIERDYTKIKAGQVWVSDHAQIDVAVKGKSGTPVFGWITSFIDMKTDKALAKVYHEEPPNSDHIFQAFFIAADTHGLPEYLYIDNGKDYRCRDFAGGRPYYHRVQVDETKTTSMLCSLNVIPIFAAPYNAQAKVIERWHLKIKEGLSKHAEGYRGGNVTERPERLAEDIKRGNILSFDTFDGLLHDFIFNVLNKLTSQGKGCNSFSPDDAWNSENPIKRTVSRLAATITHATCEENQRQSTHKYGDLRCQGCGGLDNQRLAPLSGRERSVLRLICNAEPEPEPEAAQTDAKAEAVVNAPERTTGAVLDDDTIDDFLADMFPEDDEEDEASTEQRFVELADPPERRCRRVAVYVGRCRRCGGYMTNDLERHDGIKDDDIYRCFTCGWRTSPGYENNRVLFARGVEV